MNIREAKEEIKHTVKAYLRKDKDGKYRIAPVHQRPVLLIGPPGVGKTAIVRQIAREEGIGLVAYTITHAGNPQEYNKSAREFDIVTLDRVRRIDVEVDYKVWKEYAYSRGIHPGILSWLNLHPDCFYHADQGAGEASFVTARGWEDLSVLLESYEEMGIEAGEGIIREYLQEKTIAREFAGYYQLYRKYRQDYGMGEILDGSMPEGRRKELAELSRKASVDERFSVAQMILDGWNTYFSRYILRSTEPERLWSVDFLLQKTHSGME